MNNNKTVEQHRKEVKESQRERNELELYPLSSYSTTQLKKELRRRKKNEWFNQHSTRSNRRR